MRMINSLTAVALDSARFVEVIKEREQEVLKQARQEMYDFAQAFRPEGRPGENRAQRRARERMEPAATQDRGARASANNPCC